jgi:dienelactone hydrolase
MTTAATFDDLRLACLGHTREGRFEEALGAAEEAWQRFPERRDFSWYLVARTNVAMGRLPDAITAMEAAEAENRLWRARLLQLPEIEPLNGEPRFGALLERLEARIAARGYRPQLLVAEPEPSGAGAPLLLGLHGASSRAADYHRRWLPAAALGCVVASVQSSQPAAEDAFCWDDRDTVRRDLAAVLPDLPPHGEVVMTGFSQGAAVALDLALTGDVLRATAVIGVGPSYPPTTRFPEARRRLRVVILRGAEDTWGGSVPGTVEALRAAGHEVHVDEVAGVGHDYPPDFADRLPRLLALAGVRAS